MKLNHFIFDFIGSKKMSVNCTKVNAFFFYYWLVLNIDSYKQKKNNQFNEDVLKVYFCQAVRIGESASLNNWISKNLDSEINSEWQNQCFLDTLFYFNKILIAI